MGWEHTSGGSLTYSPRQGLQRLHIDAQLGAGLLPPRRPVIRAEQLHSRQDRAIGR